MAIDNLELKKIHATSRPNDANSVLKDKAPDKNINTSMHRNELHK